MLSAGIGFVRKVTSAINPSVPKEPTKSLCKLNPLTFFTTGAPDETISPSAEI